MSLNYVILRNPPQHLFGEPLLGVPLGRRGTLFVILKNTLPLTMPKEEATLRRLCASGGIQSKEGRKRLPEIFVRYTLGPGDRTNGFNMWPSDWSDALTEAEEWMVASLGGQKNADRWLDLYGVKKKDRKDEEKAKLLAELEALDPDNLPPDIPEESHSEGPYEDPRA